jgi:hypothetical protein
MLETNLSVLITSKCTLNCKFCSSGILYYDHPQHLPVRKLVDSVQRALDLYEGGVQHLDILGGEPLLHPHLADILEGICAFRGKFPEIRLLTNCTVMPKDRLMRTISHIQEAGFRFMFILANYGILSTRFDKIHSLLKSNGVPYRIDEYSGENQYFGGWVSYGQGREKPLGTAMEIFENCAFCRSGVGELYDGKLYPCIRLLALHATGRISSFSACDDEYIDVFTGEYEYNKKKWKEFVARTEPFSICAKCGGLSVDAFRYPAAEQFQRVRSHGDL